MRALVVAPDTPGIRTGNRVTAERWAGILRELGAEASVLAEWQGEPCDLLVVLHASKGLASIERYRAAHATSPLVVGLSGTDVYGDLMLNAPALAGLASADRIVALQHRAAELLPLELRPRARTIIQSASAGPRTPPRPGQFDCCVLANLRAVKDPLLPARAARLLAPESTIEIVHAGAVLDAELGAAAEDEMADNPRYRWVGALDGAASSELLLQARVLVIPSRDEGGANVLSEALVGGTPVLATRIPGTTGLLGDDHPGLFPVGDAGALAQLLERVETDSAFLAALTSCSTTLAPRFHPDREREAWRALLAELPL